MPRRQTHQGLKFPTENILTHTEKIDEFPTVLYNKRRKGAVGKLLGHMFSRHAKRFIMLLYPVSAMVAS